MKKLHMILMLILLVGLLSATAVQAGIFDSVSDSAGGIIESLTSSKWIKIVANSIIVMILLMAFLNLKGNSSESFTGKINLPTFGLSALIGLAIGDKWIWKVDFISNLMHGPVAVNTLIYVLIFYGVYALFIKKRISEGGDSNTTDIIAIVAILVLSLSMSLSPFDDNHTWEDIKGNYQYFWQKEDVVRLKFFVFGNPETTDGKYTELDVVKAIEEAQGPDSDYKPPSKIDKVKKYNGLFKGEGIFLFIFGSLMLIWLFHFFKVGEGNETSIKELKWILAIFVAAQIANTGVDKGLFIRIMAIIFAFLLYMGMRKTITATSNYGKKIAELAVIIFVIGITLWVFSSMFPEKFISDNTDNSQADNSISDGLVDNTGKIYLDIGKRLCEEDTGNCAEIPYDNLPEEIKEIKEGQYVKLDTLEVIGKDGNPLTDKDGKNIILAGIEPEDIISSVVWVAKTVWWITFSIWDIFSSLLKWTNLSARYVLGLVIGDNIITDILAFFLTIPLLVLILTIFLIFLGGKKSFLAGKEWGQLTTNWGWRTIARVRSRVGLIRPFLNLLGDAKSTAPDNELSKITRQLRAELQAHMDYMLRFEVHFGKIKAVETNAQKAEEISHQAHEIKTHSQANALMNYYRWGTGIEFDEDNKYSLKDNGISYEDIYGRKVTKKPQQIAGFLNMNYVLLEGFRLFYETILHDDYLKEPISSPEAAKGRDWGNTLYSNNMAGQVQSLFTSGMNKYKFGDQISWENISEGNAWSYEFWKAFRKYGLLHQWRVIHEEMFDQYLLYGDYPRSYRYARYGANADVYEVEFVRPSKNSDNNERKKNTGYFCEIKWETLKKTENIEELGWYKDEYDKVQEDYLYEVRYNGFLMKDIENIKFGRVKGENKAKIRKVKQKDIIMGPLDKSCAWMHHDWEMFIEDLKFGKYSFFSRKLNDYKKIHDKKILFYGNFNENVPINGFSFREIREHIEKTPVDGNSRLASEGTTGNPAFDREAFKNHGEFPLLCRRQYFNKRPDDVKKERLRYKQINTLNPYPKISMMGISLYFKDYLDRRLEFEGVKRELNKFVWASTGQGTAFYKGIEESK